MNQRQKIEKLVEAIRAFPVEKFTTWLWNSADGRMCPGGIACNIPEFRELGLVWSDLNSDGTPQADSYPVFKGRSCSFAVAEFLEMDYTMGVRNPFQPAFWGTDGVMARTNVTPEEFCDVLLGMIKEVETVDLGV